MNELPMHRIGINPLTWSNDDMPELGAEIPLAQCLSEAHQAGYTGIELGHKFPRDATILAPLLASHQLQLISGWHSLRVFERSYDDEVAALTPHLALLKAMGCRVVIVAETTHAIHTQRTTSVSQRPILRDNEHDDKWRTLSYTLNRLADHVTAHGLALAYHHHMGTVIQSANDIAHLMARTHAGVGLLLDTGHCTFAGADPAHIIQKYSERIVHVHCKNVRKPMLQHALKNDHSFLQAVRNGVFTVPGDPDGCVDFAAVIALLHTCGYAGWLVVEAEQDPAQAHPLTYAKQGYKALQQLCAATAHAL